MSKGIEIKDDRKYTKDHEWAKLEGDTLLVGVSAFAVDQLGDITLVNFDVQAGGRVEAGKVFGTIESVKTLSDLFSPVSGQVLEVNQTLESSPEVVNEDCWGRGWMLKVRCDDVAVVATLLSASAYAELTENS
jgi:glycine cleavage system H protein